MKHDPATDTPDLFVFARDYLHGSLPKVRGLSGKTIQAYRISLECYLTYLTQVEHLERAQVGFEHFDRPRLKGWLAWMSQQRHYAPRTVTLRLTAVKTFLTYSACEDITLIALHQGVKTIKVPAAPRARIEYLTQAETTALLAAHTGTTAKSRRNRMLLILLYETAARVSEITELTLTDLHLDPPGHVTLTGKRNKTRTVPISPVTTEHLGVYLAEFHPDHARQPAARPLFYSRHHGAPSKLSTDTVAAVLKTAADTARPGCPRAHPLPPAAQDQRHGPLPARHPPADHHAATRPREHLHHRRVLRVRHPRHDAPGSQRGNPRRHQRPRPTTDRADPPGPARPTMTTDR